MINPQSEKELQELSLKNPAVKELFDFYCEIKNNGLKLLFIKMNEKYSQLAYEIERSSISLSAEDKTFERFMKIAVEAGTMQENYSKLETYMFGEKSEEKEGSFLDKRANRKRS